MGGLGVSGTEIRGPIMGNLMSKHPKDIKWTLFESGPSYMLVWPSNGVQRRPFPLNHIIVKSAMTFLRWTRCRLTDEFLISVNMESLKVSTGLKPFALKIRSLSDMTPPFEPRRYYVSQPLLLYIIFSFCRVMEKWWFFIYNHSFLGHFQLLRMFVIIITSWLYWLIFIVGHPKYG